MTTLLQEAVKLGSAARGYRFGAQGPTYYDCSGLVWDAERKINEFVGDRYTTYTILQSSQYHRISAGKQQVNDIVVWSENSAHGHMGVISGPDQFYSARDVADGMGYNRISTFHVYPVGPIYLRPVRRGSSVPVRDLYLTSPMMQGEDVKVVQRHLAPLIVDGFFGPDTRKAVMVFQKAHHLDADGVVGKLTRAAMGIK